MSKNVVMEKDWTVEDVELLFAETVGKNFAATDEGQKHLNRIAKAITNESLEKRKVSARETRAEIAFNNKLGDVAARTPDKVAEFVAAKADWIEKYIARKYGTVED